MSKVVFEMLALAFTLFVGAATFAILSLASIQTSHAQAGAQVEVLKTASADNIFSGYEVSSFVYNDTFGEYHCIYFKATYGGGLWCERVANTTKEGG